MESYNIGIDDGLWEEQEEALPVSMDTEEGSWQR